MAANVLRDSFICRHCLRRGLSTSTAPLWRPSSSTSLGSHQQQHSSMRRSTASTSYVQRRQQSHAANLTNRRLIALHGHDAPRFLHGITTNTVPGAEAPTSSSNDSGSPTSAFYSAFLNAQGRLLHDVFVYPAAHARAYRETLPEYVAQKYGADDPAFLVEVDALGVAELLRHMKRYKLRAKVDLRVLEQGEWDVVAAWSDTDAHVDMDVPSGFELGGVDLRAPGMGVRYIVPSSSSAQPHATGSLASYATHRHTHGVPESQASTHETRTGASLPHECNIDLMHGIDFKKGCYVGQELTIRTQHKGVVRKRALPVALYDISAGESAPTSLSDASSRDNAALLARVNAWPAGADIVPRGRRGRPAGRWLSGASKDVGIALCRVEVMTDAVVSTEGGARWHEGDDFVLRPRRAGGADDGEDGGPASGGETGADGATEKVDVDAGGEIGVKAFVPEWVRRGIRVR